jgi:inorganic pyrophosphatase
MDLSRIPAIDGEVVHVVVESPRGSTLKLKYEETWQAMSVSRPLSAGIVFPCDWGFIPSTRAEDGDPVDAMVLWDVPSFPGVVLRCRAVAIMYVEQNRTNFDPSVRVHNDRIMLVPTAARREGLLQDLTGISARVRAELEQFAAAATALEGKDIRVTGWGDRTEALEVIRRAVIDHKGQTS